ncbi:uncharacterized protein PADG_01414 [Paracoccidioides brasiliensis Pb18]|uniref:Aminoglycoside phosphotransferase domain-containing protein n=1 Tax=Paracoccidioides brasiliensis (strain Pb18) TaxID=502780 RepID=C1G398_PARBD|nr:uncharacterized protein PADG_01414 [Paracoccidioides brasiliensis Pb18]EEH45264.1 hypothetical protein PADG_01414 [Paracoccidioides brasiliensis Pb18]ODH51267.1 hypothetical protein GX48_02507 [Paracoccidioides brasiliensis]
MACSPQPMFRKGVSREVVSGALQAWDKLLRIEYGVIAPAYFWGSLSRLTFFVFSLPMPLGPTSARQIPRAGEVPVRRRNTPSRCTGITWRRKSRKVYMLPGSKYFQQLAEQQFLHLKYQRNDAITDEDDCRKKYVARCLFRQIAQRVLVQHGRFYLYCDDLRPSNVLVTESDLRVTGVIDWEYTYVAPAEFTYSAPWWLLFESPEAWDLDNFMDRYRPRLELFLKELRVHEDEQIRQGSLKESQRLS